MEETIINGNGTETGHIIATTVGGRNGQPKQVTSFLYLEACCVPCPVLYISLYLIILSFLLEEKKRILTSLYLIVCLLLNLWLI